LRLKLKLSKIYAGISVWAKQEGIEIEAAVIEIAQLKRSLTSLVDSFCHQKPSKENDLAGKTIKAYLTR
jgi:hypothetical protein